MHCPLLAPPICAGLTHDTNELDADPYSIQDAVSLPNATALVSLALPAAGPAGSATPDSRGEPPLLRHCAGGELTIGARCPGGGGASPLDATFHLAAPLAGESVERDDAPDGDDGNLLAAARQLLVQPVQGAASREVGVLRPAGSAGGAPEWRSQAGLRLASFEAASAPGHFLTADAATGRLVLRQARSEPPAAQTFRLHPLPRGGDGDAPDAADDEPSFELEPLSRPGSRVQLAAGSPEASAGTAVRLRLAPPAAPAYPRGARVLHGRNRDYLLVPLGQASLCQLPAAASEHSSNKGRCRFLVPAHVGLHARFSRPFAQYRHAAATCCTLPFLLQIMDESYTAYFKFASK